MPHCPRSPPRRQLPCWFTVPQIPAGRECCAVATPSWDADPALARPPNVGFESLRLCRPPAAWQVNLNKRTPELERAHLAIRDPPAGRQRVRPAHLILSDPLHGEQPTADRVVSAELTADRLAWSVRVTSSVATKEIAKPAEIGG